MSHHMTGSQKLRIERLYESGVTDVEELANAVFVHPSRVEEVLAALNGKAKPKKKAAAKKSTEVDPFS